MVYMAMEEHKDKEGVYHTLAARCAMVAERVWIISTTEVPLFCILLPGNAEFSCLFCCLFVNVLKVTEWRKCCNLLQCLTNNDRFHTGYFVGVRGVEKRG